MRECPSLGLAVWLIDERTLPARVEWAARHEFEAVAIMTNTLAIDPHEKEDAADAVREAGLTLTCHANVETWLDEAGTLDFDRVEALMVDAIFYHERAGGLRAMLADPVLRTLPSGQQEHLESQSAELVKVMDEWLAPKGIAYGLENAGISDYLFCSREDFRRFRERHDLPGLGLLLDAGHANVHCHCDNVPGETKIGDFVRGLPLPVHEVHLHDNAGAQDEHRELGRGNLDLYGLLEALRDIVFAGPLTLEVCVRPETRGYLANPKVAEDIDQILRSRDTVREAREKVWGVAPSRGYRQ